MRFLRSLFGKRDEAKGPPRAVHGIDELARRLKMSVDEIREVPIRYEEFHLPKKSGGTRRILAPAPELKLAQRAILRLVLRRLISHPATVGFERGHSIATHAAMHVNRAAVLRIDIRRFFESTRSSRVDNFFRHVGWDRKAAQLLTDLTTYQGALPQGAPTSPRLSNLVNFVLDARLDRLAAHFGALYSRYADDLTFSFEKDEPGRIKRVISATWVVLSDFEYVINHRKTRVRRRHQQQRVTGLVVNDRVNLPRQTRRRLRAVEHRLRTGRAATLTPHQFDGWRALQHMIVTQTRSEPSN